MSEEARFYTFHIVILILASLAAYYCYGWVTQDELLAPKTAYGTISLGEVAMRGMAGFALVFTLSAAISAIFVMGKEIHNSF